MLAKSLSLFDTLSFIPVIVPFRAWRHSFPSLCVLEEYEPREEELNAELC